MDPATALLIGKAATAATGTAAATTATAGIMGAGGALTLGGVMATLGTGMSLFSGIQALNAGNVESGQYQQQAQMEALRAQQDESNRKVKLNEILNNQMASFAGRGVQLGSGTDLSIATFSEEEAQRESNNAQLDSTTSRVQMLQRGEQARKSGQAGFVSGVANAATKGYNQYTRTQERKLTD